MKLTRRELAMCVLTLVALALAGVLSAKQVKPTVTLELSAAHMTALEWWADHPDQRGPVAFDDVKRTPAEWLLVFVTPRLDDLVLRFDEYKTRQMADTGKRVKTLNAQQCARLAKELGVAITSLPCGGVQ